MKRHHNKKPAPLVFSVSLAGLFALQTGCLSDAKNRGASTASAALSLASVPPLVSVDGSQLTISDITVTPYANPKTGGALQPLVNFRYSPLADYVEAQLCESENRDCREVKNLIEEKSLLPNMPDGATVFLKLRSCVKPERSTSSKNCGGWVEQQYTQWTNSDPRKRQLQEELEQVERAIKDYAESLLDLAKLKAERASKCQPATEGAKKLIEAERGFAEAIGKLGGSLVDAIADRAAKAKSAADEAAAKEKAAAEEKAAAAKTDESPKVDPTDPFKDIALRSDFDPEESALQLNGGSKVLLIVPQDPKYYSRISKVIGQSIVLRAQALREIMRSSSLRSPNASNLNLSSSAEKTFSEINNESLNGGDKPAAGEDTKTESKLNQDEKLGEGITKSTPASGLKTDLAPLIEALPDIAGAMFDLGNAERWVAANVGVCVKGFDEKQENALKFAQVAAEERKKVLEARATTLANTLKSGG
ncbi:MAG: hypothetical protein RJB13_2528 [Pseudomonadota bacterium]|jgi:hypothetical protein